MTSTTHIIQLPTNLIPQIFLTTAFIFKMLSPILVPIIAIGFFSITLEIIIKRMRQLPLEPNTGFWGRIVKQKK